MLYRGLSHTHRSSWLAVIEVAIMVVTLLVGFAISIVITAGLAETCTIINAKGKS